MKMTKKKVLVLALAICLLATASLGTLAWFNAQDEITNKFDIMSSLTDFDIDVWERVSDGDDTNTEVVGKGETGDSEYTYTDAAPGTEYQKEVNVENASESVLANQYVKVEVTFTNYAALRAMGEGNTPLDCITMLDNDNFSTTEDDDTTDWYLVETPKYDKDANTATYVFYLRNILKKGESKVLFSTVTIPETMDINDADNLMTYGFRIKVVAYAIQSANLTDSTLTPLQNAMNAFGTPWNEKDTKPETPTFPSISTP